MKILLVLSVTAVVVALFASAALAQTSGGSPTATASPTASPTASVTATAGSTAATISAAASVSPSATATATATALSKTGGPSYILPVTLAASLVLVLSGLAALRLTARRGAS